MCFVELRKAKSHKNRKLIICNKQEKTLETKVKETNSTTMDLWRKVVLLRRQKSKERIDVTEGKFVPNTNARGQVWKEKMKDSKTELNNENGFCFPLVLLFLKWGSFTPQTPRLFCGHVNMLASILVLHFDFWGGAVLLVCFSSGKTRRRIALSRSVGMCNFEKEKTWKREGFGEAAHRLWSKKTQTKMMRGDPKNREVQKASLQKPQPHFGASNLSGDGVVRAPLFAKLHSQLREMSWQWPFRKHISIVVTKPFFGAKMNSQQKSGK